MRTHILTLVALTALAAQGYLWSHHAQKITVVNRTGYEITSLSLSPGSEQTLAAGQSAEVACDGPVKSWDLYVGWDDDEDDGDEFSGLKPGHTYALLYDEDSDETSLKEL